MITGVLAYLAACTLLVMLGLTGILYDLLITLGLRGILYDHEVLLILIPIILVFTIMLAADYMYQKYYIKKYFYNMTDKFLIIRKGIFAPQEITVPLKRIQDVYVDQDIVDKLLDIYDVHISTATETSTERAHIDGVDKKIAEELRKRILDKLH